LALALSGTAAAVLLGGAVGAVAATSRSDVCKKLTANLHMPTATLSACTSDRDAQDPGVVETGSGTFPLSAITTGAGTITWKPPYEGGTAAAPRHTDVKVVATAVGGPGQPADEAETTPCPAGQQELKITGTVGPTDTTDTPPETDVGGRVTAEACVNSATGAVILEPGTAFRISAPQPG
jgi:hypothetical protein